MKISIEHYIATNNPSAVELMFAKRGIPSAKNLPDALNKLRTILKREGDIAAKELATIPTPYQQMISSIEENSNACGCNEKKSNCCGADGNGENSNGNDVKNNNTETIPVPITPTPTQAPLQQAKEEKQDDKITKAMPYVAVGLLLIATTAIFLKK